METRHLLPIEITLEIQYNNACHFHSRRATPGSCMGKEYTAEILHPRVHNDAGVQARHADTEVGRGACQLF